MTDVAELKLNQAQMAKELEEKANEIALLQEALKEKGQQGWKSAKQHIGTAGSIMGAAQQAHAAAEGKAVLSRVKLLEKEQRKKDKKEESKQKPEEEDKKRWEDEQREVDTRYRELMRQHDGTRNAAVEPEVAAAMEANERVKREREHVERTTRVAEEEEKRERDMRYQELLRRKAARQRALLGTIAGRRGSSKIRSMV